MNKDIRCEYHNYKKGCCINCGNINIKHGIFILGNSKEEEKELISALNKILEMR